jgi:hypothetical protein
MSAHSDSETEHCNCNWEQRQEFTDVGSFSSQSGWEKLSKNAEPANNRSGPLITAVDGQTLPIQIRSSMFIQNNCWATPVPGTAIKVMLRLILGSVATIPTHLSEMQCCAFNGQLSVIPSRQL